MLAEATLGVGNGLHSRAPQLLGLLLQVWGIIKRVIHNDRPPP